MSDIDLKKYASLSSPDENNETVENEAVTSPGSKKTSSRKRRVFKVLAVLLVILLVLGGFAGFAGYTAWKAAMGMQAQGMAVRESAMLAYDAMKAQNLKEADAQLQETKKRYQILRNQYDQYAFAGSVPVLKLYYQDGQAALNAGQAGVEAAEVAIKAIEPYADVLGFAGEGTFTGGSVENRIQLALATLSKIGPQIDTLTQKLDQAAAELNKIDENRYPEHIRGRQVRSQIKSVKQLVSGAGAAIQEARPVLEVLPDVAGANGKRKKYFVLFQNDNELRPTGGFMTAFATLYVENGRVTPDRSEDIYEIDKKFANKPPIPDILKKYLTTEKKWNLRDMNMSPDFKESMETFWSYYSKLPGENAKDIDGIIAIDTNVLERLVEVLGPVEVPGYGTFSAQTDARCDCPQIIYAMSEIVDRPTPYIRENRKGIIGPMMQSILNKAYSAPNQQWPTLFETAWQSIEGRHVQFYMFDEKQQQAAEAVNAAGSLQAPTPGEDYLYIVDANLGGAKSNLFVTSNVQQEVMIPENGRLQKTVTMTYKNPFKASNCNLEAGQLCLNARLFNWQRLYLPKDAKLVSSTGYKDETVETTTDTEHTILQGVFAVDPMGQTKVTVTYTIPYADSTDYILTMQKQGGTKGITHVLTVNGGEHEVVVDKDSRVQFAF